MVPAAPSQSPLKVIPLEISNATFMVGIVLPMVKGFNSSHLNSKYKSVLSNTPLNSFNIYGINNVSKNTKRETVNRKFPLNIGRTEVLEVRN